MIDDRTHSADPNLTAREFSRRYLMEGSRERKRNSPFASLPDLGIALPPEEETKVRAYAEKLGVDFDRIAEEFAAFYQIIPERNCTKMLASLADKGLMPVNHMKICLELWIYNEHYRSRGRETK